MPTIGSRHFRDVRDMSDISNLVLLTLVQTMNFVILSGISLLRRVVNRDTTGTMVKSTFQHILGLCVPDGDAPIFFHSLNQPQLRHTRRVAFFTHIEPLIGTFFTRQITRSKPHLNSRTEPGHAQLPHRRLPHGSSNSQMRASRLRTQSFLSVESQSSPAHTFWRKKIYLSSVRTCMVTRLGAKTPLSRHPWSCHP